MPPSTDPESLGPLVRKVIDEGCERLEITRGELASRVGMHRVSLYNLLNRPGGISLQSLVKILDALEVENEKQGFIVYKWCEDRTASNHFAELLFPVLEDLCADNDIAPADLGHRVLEVFRRLHKS